MPNILTFGQVQASVRLVGVPVAALAEMCGRDVNWAKRVMVRPPDAIPDYKSYTPLSQAVFDMGVELVDGKPIAVEVWKWQKYARHNPTPYLLAVESSLKIGKTVAEISHDLRVPEPIVRVTVNKFRRADGTPAAPRRRGAIR